MKKVKQSKPIYKTTGDHYNCYFADFFWEVLTDDFWEDGKLVLVDVDGGDIDEFEDEENEIRARSIFDNCYFNKIGSIDYGDWTALESLVGKNEKNELCKQYFDCDDYKNTKSVVLLYYDGSFVTLVH